MNVKTVYLRPRSIGIIFQLGVIGAFIGLLLTGGIALAAVTISDINPNVSTNGNANASSGGRVNGLASDASNNQIFYVASEYGGLFKTTDGGMNWFRLTGHLPVVTWDVEVDSGNANRVYATSWYDGRLNSLAGIEVSNDGGATWTHPATAVPPATFNCAAARRAEPAAFGIGIRPDASQNVFVGTNCGVAISTDSGATWTFVDPTPATTASDVWDVVVQAGGPTSQGIVDICGDDGHWRSTDGGVNWTGGSAVLPGGRCAIAASPDESYVLFVVIGTRIFESDDGGATWPTEYANPALQGRIPFVATNQRSDSGGTNRFSLWFGDVQLFRADCTTPASPAQGGAARCPASGSWSNQQNGAHFDGGDLVFDTAVTVDACPRIYSSDGGVHRNTDLGSDCQNPNWTRSNAGMHALWVWSMDGANQTGDTNENLYFGNQDNGTFASADLGAPAPNWSNPNCCDTFDVLADSNWVLGTVCCFNMGRFNRLELANPGYTGQSEINTYPAGTIPGFTWGKRLARFGTNQVALLTSSGVFITNNITANPIVWTQIGTNTPANGCGMYVALATGTPTFFLQVGGCTGATGDQVWSYAGTAPGGTWQRIDNNDGIAGGFGIFGVDPNDPTRMYASNLAATGPQMVFSNNAGQNWDNDPELDNLMTGSGVFPYRNQRGPVTNRGSARANFNGYPQPSLIAYDPENSNILVAGGQDSGIFISTDGGRDWVLKSDPLTSNTSGIPHISRPRYAYFDHEPANKIQIYIGTQGQGVWRLSLDPPPIAEANGPYVTDEGVDVPLDVTGSNDPGGGPLTFAWDFDGDGEFDDSALPGGPFNLVGQDGVFEITLRVTDSDGFSAIDVATVTVNNVAPTVTLTSDTPVPEGSAVTVSGIVSDPGWLDPLTATIDWGDGTPLEPITGTLENVPPDATLTFSTSHVYGDNGTFTAQVCGSDDDTTTCATLALQIDNVNPTAEIDETGAVLINGIPTFLAHAGDPIDFSGRSTDPGSDDLSLNWDWNDGPPAPDVTTLYLVNPPNLDPFPSPSVQPRDVTDVQTHAFADACLYEIVFSALDDDGGSASDTATVLIAGNARRARQTGYWQHQFGGQGRTDFDEAMLRCYLSIVNHVSTVFSEARDASTIRAGYEVLFLKENGGSEIEKLDRELMTAWLNFANGAFEYDQLFDPDHDGVFTPFSEIMAQAEAVRLSTTSTLKELREQRKILQQLR